MFYPRYFLAASLACLTLALAGCSGTTSTSQARTSAVSTTDNDTLAPKENSEGYSIPAARAKTNEARTPVARIEPKQKVPSQQAPKQDVPPVQTTLSAPSPTLTLPTPATPPIDVPGAPPEVKETKAEPVEPATREVTVSSGTTVSIRMIDSVDSATGHVGETFKASLDSPIIVDNLTVFPRGAQVYVKLTKVESAGSLSGKSELQLQLDRIFLGNRSYTLESNSFENTGASQGTRTARGAGLGAAIGAAIGAISGGGKGAIIGGATGAGAGVGVEAIRKGEQIRVDSETRLDFQLQNPVEVTIQLPSPTNSSPHRTLSGPNRFGTRP